MKPEPVLSLLGLAKKAGKIKSGSFAVEEAVKTQEAFLVICATDASERTQKDTKNMCQYYNVPWFFYGTKDTLGKCVGREYNALLCVTDQNFAGTIQKKAKP